jgi:D-xylose transport system substrate-binding protein
VRTNKRALAALVAVAGLTAAGCSSSGSNSGSSPSASPATATVASAPAVSSSASTSAATGVSSSATTSTSTSSASLTAASFNSSFSAMSQLTSLAASGKGKIGVILPDTTSSARYIEFDAPYLKEAFSKAGLPSSDYTIQNAQGSDATALTDAKADITNGATVLAIDPEDPAGGIAIEKYAAQQGVKVIDYDRLTLGGNRDYYVSFNNVEVGTLIGQGLVSCVAAWKVAKPDVIVMKGAPTDNNATLFAQGYNAVMKPYFSSGKWTEAAQPAGTWTPATALSEFQQAYTANQGANSALIPNDENGAPIISYLKTQGIKPKTFPTTGQDATLVGLQNIISGYQCGTAYKPIYLEAQAAAALAIYLRAGQTPPAGLVNGTTQDTTENKAVSSVLLTAEWVTPTNMEATIVKDKAVPVSQICAGAYATDCKEYGIS